MSADFQELLAKHYEIMTEQGSEILALLRRLREVQDREEKKIAELEAEIHRLTLEVMERRS